MKKSMAAILAGLCLITVLLAALWVYSDRSIRRIEQQSGEQDTYERHYAMISSDRSDLWQAVYEGARVKGRECGAYMEWIGEDSPVEYDTADCLRIAAAAHVDGIFLCPEKSAPVEQLMEEAAGQGIPVVTALEDVSDSGRISYVGQNSYEMGELYGGQILECLGEGENRVMVLLGSGGGAEDFAAGLMYARMIQVVDQGKKPGQQAVFETRDINTATSFDAEEDIRDIVVDRQRLPDVLICLDLISTECACQALVDHNEVGNVSLIGFYASDMVLDAIAKGVMKSTLGIDGEAVGRQCVEALEEYRMLGNVSNYFNVELEVIDQEEASSMLSGQAAEELTAETEARDGQGE